MNPTLYIEGLLLVCLANSVCGLGDLRGTIQSPNFPRDYPRNAEMRYNRLKANRYSFFVITFDSFRTENVERTDYLMIIDGRKSDRPDPVYIYGWKETPFHFVSKTNRLHLTFISDRRNNYRGFSASYASVDRRFMCDTDKLAGMGMRAVSCSNQVHKYARQCRVECNENFRMIGSNDVTTCSDGSFSSVCKEDCDVSTLQTNHSMVTSCSPFGSRVSECDLQCTNNYAPSGDMVTRCVGRSFTEVKCRPIPGLVKRCEETEMQSCPYEMKEVVDFYAEDLLDVDSSLTAQEREEEERVLAEVPGPLESVGRSTRIVCRKQYCKRKFVNWKPVYKFKCGRLTNPQKRVVCIVCRYVTQCNGVPRRYMS